MGSKIESYIEQYSSYSMDKLRGSLSSFKGQPETNVAAQERAEAIRRVIAMRNGESPTDADEPAPVLRSGDEYLAWKYLTKAENARERGIEFSLSIYDMRRLLSRKTCAYTGMRLLDKVKNSHPQKRTIERIDSSKGYVPGNVIACTLAANNLKNHMFEMEESSMHMTPSALLRFAKAMAKGAAQ